MKISIIGAGYVGLVTGTCLADSGNEVACLDNDPEKIAALRQGEVPIYEPGLTELIKNNARAGRLRFTDDPAKAVAGARCIFICVGTPQRDDGSANLEYVRACCLEIAPHLAEDAIVVVKSTVPVGANRQVASWLKEAAGRDIATASNPEFLKEGAAIDDFTKPDRVVVGADSEDVVAVLAGDESVPLLVVEELHCARRHVGIPFDYADPNARPALLSLRNFETKSLSGRLGDRTSTPQDSPE